MNDYYFDPYFDNAGFGMMPYDNMPMYPTPDFYPGQISPVNTPMVSDFAPDPYLIDDFGCGIYSNPYAFTPDMDFPILDPMLDPILNQDLMSAQLDLPPLHNDGFLYHNPWATDGIVDPAIEIQAALARLEEIKQMTGTEDVDFVGHGYFICNPWRIQLEDQGVDVDLLFAPKGRNIPYKYHPEEDHSSHSSYNQWAEYDAAESARANAVDHYRDCLDRGDLAEAEKWADEAVKYQYRKETVYEGSAIYVSDVEKRAGL